MNEPPTSTNSRVDQSDWIACEIHDGILPWITGALMQLSRVRVTPESQQMFQTAIHCLKHATEEGRALMNYLETQSKNCDVSLSRQIAELVEKLTPLIHQADQKISTHIQIDSKESLSAEQTLVILRVIQQAVQNAIQHAGPADIRIRARETDVQFIVEITDSGNGFDSTTPPKSGFGLSSMRERAKSINGCVEVSSQPGAGTQVQLSLPRRINFGSI